MVSIGYRIGLNSQQQLIIDYCDNNSTLKHGKCNKSSLGTMTTKMKMTIPGFIDLSSMEYQDATPEMIVE